jgi:hypothetical protein
LTSVDFQQKTTTKMNSLPDSSDTHNSVYLWQLDPQLYALENTKSMEDQQINHDHTSVPLPDMVQANIDSPSPQEGQFKPCCFQYFGRKLFLKANSSNQLNFLDDANPLLLN